MGYHIFAIWVEAPENSPLAVESPRLRPAAFSPIMRTGQMQKAGQRQAEDRVIGLAGHRGRDRRDAMVGILAGNNFASLIMAF